MKTIFSKLLYEMEKQHDTVLVTIIKEAGSTPRGIGAQMLVNSGGLQLGTIGGGNVENLAIAHAKELIEKKQSDLHEYKLYKNKDEDIGMVCGGDVTVLFSFVSSEDNRWNEVATALIARIDKSEKGFLILPVNGEVAYISDSEAGKDAFSMPLCIGERAILFGAGHCTLALVPLLHSVNFRVTVFDDRSDFVTRERFPLAHELICGDFDKVDKYLTLNSDDYVVVMTSGHSHDFEVQKQVLRSPLAYIGVIGSHRKTETVNAKLRKAGIDEEAITSVHTPIGVPIKAVTTEEIAVSIAGEMIYERALRREKLTICDDCK